MRGNEAAGGAGGLCFEGAGVETEGGVVGGGWGGVGQGRVHKRVPTFGVSELEEERRRTRGGRHLEMFRNSPLAAQIGDQRCGRQNVHKRWVPRSHARSFARRKAEKKGDADRSLGPRLSAVLCKFKGPACNF